MIDTFKEINIDNILKLKLPSYDRMIRNYNNYIINELYSERDILSTIGDIYFHVDCSIDEIIEGLNELTISKYCRLGDVYKYISFFYISALYRKQIDNIKADYIHHNYLSNKKFINNLVNFTIDFHDSENDTDACDRYSNTYDKIIKLLKECNYA